MKKFFRFITTTFFSLVLIANGLALEKVFAKETLLYPEQPSLVYHPSFFSVNPFKMTSYGSGWGSWKFPKNTTEVFIPSYWSKNLMGACWDFIKVDVPYYQDKVSLGFELSRSLHTFDIFKVHHASYSTELLVGPKGRLPFYTALGHLGFVISPKVGLTYLSPNDKPGGFGATTGISLGAEYYFSQWMGCYLEYSVKYSYVPLILSKEVHDPYHYFTSSVTFGLKTTL